MEFNIFKLVYSKKNGTIQFEDKIPFQSVVWEEKYNDLGKVQAVFPKNDYTIKLIKPGKFCSITPGINANFAYIHSVKIKSNEVWAYGYEAKWLWTKRGMINLGTNNGKVDIATAIQTSIKENGGFSFLQSINMPPVGTANLDTIDYTNVYEYITKALSLVSAGWRVTFAENLGTVSIYGIPGTDKSDIVRFAAILGNAPHTEYTLDNQSDVNLVRAIGLDGETPITVEVSKSNPDGEIYSAYLDLRQDFPKPDDMTLANYREALSERCRMSLIARYPRETIKVTDIDTSEFGTAYNLGDIVEVVLRDLDIAVKMRVIGSKRTIEGNVDDISIELSKV